MSTQYQVIAITIVLAVILDLYIIRRLHQSRSPKKEREQAGNSVSFFQKLKGRYKSAMAFWGKLWRNLWLNEHRAMQVIATLSAIVATTAIGCAYAQEIAITIYPLLFWLSAIFITILILYPAPKWNGLDLHRAWPILLLLAAAFLVRFIRISDLPPGLHTDENGTAMFSQLHVFNPLDSGKTINPFTTDSNFQPAFYDYIWRLSIGIFGFSLLGARMSSVIAGTLAVGATFFMMDQVASRRMAWLTSILMAAYHYHVHWSRIALDNIWVTLWVPLAIGLFLRGWNKNRPGDSVLAGLVVGLSAYFYVGGYFIIPLLLFLMWQIWRKSKEHIRFALYSGKMTATALVVAAPILCFAARFSSRFFVRAQSLYAWNPVYSGTLTAGTFSGWDYFLFQLSHSFGAYNIFTDITGFYGPNIPFLIGFASVFFLWGTGWALYKKEALPLVWIVLVTVLGGVIIFGTPSSSHFIGAIPAICWLVAIPIDWLIENNRKYWAYTLLTVILVTDLFFYFAVYASHPSIDLRAKFPLVEPYTHQITPK